MRPSISLPGCIVPGMSSVLKLTFIVLSLFILRSFTTVNNLSESGPSLTLGLSAWLLSALWIQVGLSLSLPSILSTCVCWEALSQIIWRWHNDLRVFFLENSSLSYSPWCWIMIVVSSNQSLRGVSIFSSDSVAVVNFTLNTGKVIIVVIIFLIALLVAHFCVKVFILFTVVHFFR